MIPHEIISILEKDENLKSFLANAEKFEVFYKVLRNEELSELMEEYPKLLPAKYKDAKHKMGRGPSKISCLTVVKRDRGPANYIKLKKIKLYVDAERKKAIKILEN